MGRGGTEATMRARKRAKTVYELGWPGRERPRARTGTSKTVENCRKPFPHSTGAAQILLLTMGTAESAQEHIPDDVAKLSEKLHIEHLLTRHANEDSAVQLGSLYAELVGGKLSVESPRHSSLADSSA